MPNRHSFSNAKAIKGSIAACLGGFMVNIGGVPSLAAIAVIFTIFLPWLFISEYGVITTWLALNGGSQVSIVNGLGVAIIVIPLFIIIWIINSIGHHIPLISKRMGWLDALVITYTALYMISVLLYTPSSSGPRSYLGNIVAGFSLYWIVRTGNLSRTRLRYILIAIFAGAFGSAIFNIFSYYSGHFQISSHVERLKAVGFGINIYAAYLIAAIGIGVALLSFVHGVLRNLVFTGMVVISVSILLAVSRSAFLGFISIIVIWVGFSLQHQPGRQKRSNLLLMLIEVSCAIAFIGGAEFHTYQRRIDTIFNFRSDLTTNDRYYLWPMAVRAIEDHPLFGLGVGRFYTPNEFESLASQTNAPDYLKPQVAHNMFLDIGTDVGGVGIVLMISMLAIAVIRLLDRDCSILQERVGIIAGLVGFVVTSQFQPNEWGSSLFVLLGLCQYVYGLSRHLNQQAAMVNQEATAA